MTSILENLVTPRILTVILCFSFIHCTSRRGEHIFSSGEVPGRQQYTWSADSIILVFSSRMIVPLDPVYLDKGKYSFTFKARGDIAANILPNFSIFFGKLFITDKSVTTDLNTYTVNFEIREPMTAPLQFEFTNDYSTASEDRNAYLYFPVVLKPF